MSSLFDTPGPPRPYVHIPANPHPRGRDFVVGDIHGQYQALMEELLAVEFDCRVDRLFSVGDLVDRGPQNMECLRLLRQPWFFAVLGNHEAMLLTAYGLRPSCYHGPRDSAHNGGAWVYDLNRQEQAELGTLLQLLNALPLVLSVDHSAGAFNVAHAQLLHPGERQGRGDAARDEAGATWRTEAHFTWARSLAVAGRKGAKATQLELAPGERLLVSKKPWERGLRLSYVGHNVLDAPLLHRSHLHIDRGATYIPSDADSRILVLEHGHVMRQLARLG